MARQRLRIALHEWHFKIVRPLYRTISETIIRMYLTHAPCLTAPAYLITRSARAKTLGRNRQANLHGLLKIDDQLKLFWLLHRKIGGLGALQDLLDLSRHPPKTLGIADQYDNQPPASPCPLVSKGYGLAASNAAENRGAILLRPTIGGASFERAPPAHIL
jgi:hypothetical protein